jgi:VIT1/CCC1 family predicted Fe2+/Mn2+ transporter
MDPRADLWLENLVAERDGAELYERLAASERDPARAKSFQELAAGERRHADVWARKLNKEGVSLPPHRSSGRTRVLAFLARRLGTRAILPLIVDAELGDAEKYTQQGGDAAALAEEERGHEAVLKQMSSGTSDSRGLILRRERWHRMGHMGSLRAAVFGMNDGLVSNLALVLGVAGAGVSEHALRMTGLAGLLAGGCSMAVGELTSVSSQRDVLARQIALERREIEEAPEEEKAELILIYAQKGLSAEQASALATQMMKNPEQALDTLVREELGLDPTNLGSPWAAAGSSLVTFAVGALIPVLPFFFAPARLATWISVGLAIVTLAIVGTGLGFLSGTSPFKSALRMVALAVAAAAVTNLVGRAFGAALS